MVDAIVRYIEGTYGWKCWFVERDLPPGHSSHIEAIAEMIDNSTVFILLSSSGAATSQDAQAAVSHAMATEMKRIELKMEDVNGHTLNTLNQRLHELIVKKGTSYKDSEYVDDGYGAVSKMGIKAFVFLLIAVIGGFFAIRTFDTMTEIPNQPQVIVHESNNAEPRPAESEQALQQALELAEAGDIHAMYELGHLLSNTSDYEEAAYWFRKAAEEEHIRSILALGSLYWNGANRHNFGDRIEAYHWFYKAAELGHIDMQRWVAGFYRSGATIEGVMHEGDVRTLEIPQSYEAAIYWYRRAAEQGHSGAQTSLGVMYIMGEGTAVNPEKAAYWYRQAAMQGHAGAQGNLGISYALGQGVQQCYNQAAYWFRRSAELGNAPAQVNLAWIYEHGLDGHFSLEESFYWNHRAASLGHLTALSNVGLMYMQGRGISQCYEQAEYWFKQAEARNCERAIRYLALMHETEVIASEY